jgi:hypothetical protein
LDIKVDTLYDYDAWKKFQRFFMFRGKYYKVKRTIFIAFIPLLIAAIVIELTAFGPVRTKSVIYSCVGLVTVLLIGFLYFIRPKLFYNKSNLKNVLNTYIFTEDKMIVSSTANGLNGSSEVSYSFFRKAYETDDSIYIFRALNEAFIISKNNLNTIAAKNLRNLLKSKLPPKKYIICK